jgi:hypothetical protein
MEDFNGNGKGAAPPPMPPSPPVFNPEDILHQVTVGITKDGVPFLICLSDDLPLIINLLIEGLRIANKLVAQALPKLIIPVTGPLPPGVVPFGQRRG